MIEKWRKKTKTNTWLLKNILTPDEIEFCRLYVSEDFFWNWVHSYMKAFNTPYDSAKVQASLLLNKKEIWLKILEFLDKSWLNETTADKTLLMLMLQNEERNVQLWAVRLFYDITARIEKWKQKALKDWDISKDVLWLTITDLREKSIDEINQIKKELLK